MSYKDLLKRQIKDLEERIAEAEGDKEVLQKELNRLKVSEFEEDLATDTNQQFLKG